MPALPSIKPGVGMMRPETLPDRRSRRDHVGLLAGNGEKRHEPDGNRHEDTLRSPSRGLRSVDLMEASPGLLVGLLLRFL
jgi:hypothetical protein